MTILDTIVQSKRLKFPQSGIDSTALLNAFQVPHSGIDPTALLNGFQFPTALLKGQEYKKDMMNPLTTNSFVRSLRQDGISIIGEIKPSSPSAGKLLEVSHLPEILTLYKQHCTAISVLTDEQFFGGSFDLLTHVKQTTGLPVLCKDFIISTDQILLAKKHGADAVLLIAKILEGHELVALINSALGNGLCPVVEINNLSDLQAIEGLPVEVVLINNRNLDTMEIDLNTTHELACLLNEEQIVISASGIKTNEQIQQLLPSSRRFLIGTSLMQSPDPATLLTELTGSTLAYSSTDVPKIKICGITNSADANMAVEAGAEFIGLIFAPSSKRQVSTEQARVVVEAVKQRAKIVGVFQNQSIEEVNRTAEELNLDFIQLHGEEDSSFVSTCVRPVIKAFQYSSTQTVSNQRLLEFAEASYFLFDLDKSSHDAGLAEATGPSSARTGQNSFAVLADSLNPVRDRIPPFFLAGKLSPANVQQASQAVLPFALDVASGVEISPRKKSPTLTKQFCNLAKSRQNTHAPQVVNQ